MSKPLPEMPTHIALAIDQLRSEKCGPLADAVRELWEASLQMLCIADGLLDVALGDDAAAPRGLREKVEARLRGYLNEGARPDEVTELRWVLSQLEEPRALPEGGTRGRGGDRVHPAGGVAGEETRPAGLRPEDRRAFADHARELRDAVDSGVFGVHTIAESLAIRVWQAMQPVLVATEPPRCPACGYTKDDCRFHMDHHLCGLPEPSE